MASMSRTQGFQRLLARAEAGETEAQCLLSESFMKAETAAGYRRALPWLRRAAAANDPWAKYILGYIYDHGRAGRQDRRQARIWYERAAAQGDPSARLNLGIILANLPGKRRNLKRAIQLYRLSAKQGRPNAAYNLGLYYSEGRGVKKSLKQAKRWYRKAAQLQIQEARELKKLRRS